MSWRASDRVSLCPAREDRKPACLRPIFVCTELMPSILTAFVTEQKLSRVRKLRNWLQKLLKAEPRSHSSGKELGRRASHFESSLAYFTAKRYLFTS